MLGFSPLPPSLVHLIVLRSGHINGTPGRRVFTSFRSHNLSNRYKILEESVRGLNPSTIIRDEILAGRELREGEHPQVIHGRSGPARFHGIAIPKRPPTPDSDDCCMSSCTVCVYDLYATSLEEYQHQLTTSRDKLLSLGISPAEWPRDFWTEDELNSGVAYLGQKGVTKAARVRADAPNFAEMQANIVVTAFIEFERSRREKDRIKG